jgi:hypothetical protein
MRLSRAVEILSKLRDGEDPRTGKALPESSPCQSPEVVRALFTALAELPRAEDDAPVETAPSDRPKPTRAGKPWTKEEDDCLGAGFDEGRGVAELSRLFDRSRSAIRLRLVKLGRLSAEDVMLGRSRKRPSADAPVAAAAG